MTSGVQLSSNLYFILTSSFLQMNDDDVLQSGFALLGDLADFCYDAIRAQVNEIVILCEAEMRKLEDTPSLSNAVWSLGKIIEKMGGCGY